MCPVSRTNNSSFNNQQYHFIQTSNNSSRQHVRDVKQSRPPCHALCGPPPLSLTVRAASSIPPACLPVLSPIRQPVVSQSSLGLCDVQSATSLPHRATLRLSAERPVSPLASAPPAGVGEPPHPVPAPPRTVPGTHALTVVHVIPGPLVGRLSGGRVVVAGSPRAAAGTARRLDQSVHQLLGNLQLRTVRRRCSASC